MKNNFRIVIVMILSCVLSLSVATQYKTEALVPGNNAFFNLTTSGGQSTAGRVSDISGDGKFTVFSSGDSNLVTSDTNNKEDVFVRDLSNNITSRVSISTGGTESNGASYEAKISYDGRYIVFTSQATNLTTDYVTGGSDAHVFRHDRTTGITELVSKSISGNVPNLWQKHWPDINADGRFVVYSSADQGLLDLSAGISENIIVRDMVLGTTKLISPDSSGNPSSGQKPRISCDGGIVVFESSSYSSKSPSVKDIIMNVRSGGENITNITPTATQGGSTNADVSCDGNHIVFTSNALSMVGGSTGPFGSAHSSERHVVFHYNNINKTTEVASKKANGNMVATQDGSSPLFITVQAPSISGDGKYIAYSSFGNPLNDGSIRLQVYLTNTQTGTTERISKSPSSAYGNWHSYNAFLSSNAKYVAYYSEASNLTSTDTNGNFSDLLLGETGL